MGDDDDGGEVIDDGDGEQKDFQRNRHTAPEQGENAQRERDIRRSGDCPAFERDRVAVRLDLAEHQLKQLQLDLTRDAAASLETPELSSRLQVIRSELDVGRE